jgi:2-polyprenyl-3-methyl-5-hydroxy-6-metoxy-1,4-benzoquinol methylase
MPADQRDLNQFYDQAWEKWDDMVRYSPAPRIRRHLLLSWMRGLPLQSLLDVGCGNGVFLDQARRELAPGRLVGADISPQVIESDRRRLPGMEFHVLDLERQSLDERFDAVVCMELVEHCADPHAAIARLASMVGGWLFLSVPCGPLFEIDRRVGHHRHFQVQEIRQALEQAGLTVLKLQAWGFPFFNLYKHLINLSPDQVCGSFLSDRGYGPGQRLVSSALYWLFKLNLPLGGYQLLAMARR